MAELIRYIKKRIMLIILFPLRILPIRKNRVFLHNDLAQKYSDNPKVVAERLLSSFPGRFQIVYSVKEKTTSSHLAEKGILPVKYLSLQYYYYAMTSHVFLTNSGGFSYLPLKTNQYVINTWHGGGAYKKVGIYMYGNTPLFRKDLQLSAKKTNVFLSSSSRFTEIISESMLIPRSCFWEIGMPRNDNLVQIMPNMREEIQKSLGLRDNEKLVLYAPTYRKPADDYFQESIGMNYGIDPERVCFALQKRFGGKWKFAFRLHPRITNRSAIPQGCMDFSNYEDMQDLLIAADVMINDFSSSMWDFMLTGKPCFIFAIDLQHYINTTEVHTPVSEWPFPRATNNEELERNIIGFDEEKYSADCKSHYEMLGGCETGEATKLVCDRIYNVCFEETGRKKRTS